MYEAQREEWCTKHNVRNSARGEGAVDAPSKTALRHDKMRYRTIKDGWITTKGSGKTEKYPVQ